MTLAQLKEFNNLTIIDAPFGRDDYQDMSFPSYVAGGFMAKYATPVANGGTRVDRHLMNGLGYLATIGTFLDSVGYQYGWHDPTSFGGYPKGAVVSQFDGTHLYEFVNTVENNLQPPVVAGDGTSTEDSSEQNGWLPLHKMKEYSFFPDYSSRSLLYEFTILPSDTSFSRVVSISSAAWLLIERTITNWDDLDAWQRMGYITPGTLTPTNSIPPEATIDISGSDSSYGPMRISLYEGETSSRFLPCSGTLRVTGRCYGAISGMTIRIYGYAMEDA